MENWPLNTPVLPVDENVNGMTIGFDVFFSVNVPDAEYPEDVFSILDDLN